MATTPITTSERILAPLGPVGLPSPIIGGASAGGISVGDVLSMLRQRLVTIILLWFFFGSLAVGGFMIAYKYYPIWTSEGWIEVKSDRPKGPMTLEAPGYSRDEAENLIKTQAVFVKLPTVLSTVLRTKDVMNTDWYRSLAADERYVELDEDLASAPVRGTTFIKVAMGTHAKLDARVIVHAVMDVYLREVKLRARTRYQDDLDRSNDELKVTKDQIEAKARQIQGFMKTLPPGELNRGGGTLGPQTMLTVEQVSQFELFVSQLRKLKEIYASASGPALSPDDKQLVEESSEVSELVRAESAIDLQVKSTLKKFGENHAEVKDLQGQLDTVQDKLEQVRKRRLNEIAAWKRDQAEVQYLEYQEALLQARERLADFEAQQADLDRKLGEYETLREELVLLRIQEERVVEFIRDLTRVVREEGAIDVSIAQPPVDPLERSWPKWYLLAVGIGVALLLSCVLAVAFELLDTSVRTPQDIVRHLMVPLLGTVPDLDDEEIDIEQVETAVRQAPQSMIAEAFRTIRANLQFSAPADRQRSLVITSPRPDDGKTAIACNLAVSLAQAGRRILLVDANFRRPGIHRVFGNGQGKGLSNILIGDATLEQCKTKTDLPTLDVLTTGPLPPSPVELINSDPFRRFLDEATGVYDQVLFDTPPVLLASDALVLATLVDGAILVCRARENSRGAAHRAVSLLHRINAHVFGAVLNAAQVRRGGYFREQFRTFYEYQSENENRIGDNGQPKLPQGGSGTNDS